MFHIVFPLTYDFVCFLLSFFIRSKVNFRFECSTLTRRIEWVMLLLLISSIRLLHISLNGIIWKSIILWKSYLSPNVGRKTKDMHVGSTMAVRINSCCVAIFQLYARMHLPDQVTVNRRRNDDARANKQLFCFAFISFCFIVSVCESNFQWTQISAVSFMFM